MIETCKTCIHYHDEGTNVYCDCPYARDNDSMTCFWYEETGEVVVEE